MLGAHPDVICIPEAQFIVDLMPSDDPCSEIDPRDIIERVARHTRFRLWNFDLKGRLPPADTPPTYRASIEWLVRAYAAENGRATPKFWVDQQPGHVLHVWRLQQHFPDARFVHIVRDGRAVAASVMALDWGPNEIYPAAVYWRQRLGFGFAAAHALGPERFTTVRYEDLVVNPETVMRKLAAFIGTDYDESMLKPTGLNLPEFTVPQHRLVGGFLSSEGIDAWSKKLTRRQLEIFEHAVGDLLPLLGYERQTPYDTRAVSGLEKMAQYFKDKTKARINKWKFRKRVQKYLS